MEWRKCNKKLESCTGGNWCFGQNSLPKNKGLKRNFLFILAELLPTPQYYGRTDFKVPKQMAKSFLKNCFSSIPFPKRS